MGRQDAKVDAVVRGALHPGEELLATCRVDYDGTVASNELRLDVGITAGLGDADLSPPDPEAAIFFPAAPRMVLAVTPRRLLAWGLGFWSEPKHRLTDVPLDAVASVRSEDTAAAAHVVLTMSSGEQVDLRCRHGAGTDRFVAALAGALDARSS